MRQADERWVPVLLLFVAVGGAIASVVPPPGSLGTGAWPIGLATAALVLTRRRAVPTVLTVIAGIALGTLLLGERPAGMAVGYAVGISVECVVIWAILTDRGRLGRPTLTNDVGLRRFLRAVFLGTAAGAVVTVVTALLVGFEAWRAAALMAGSHLTSHLIILPFAAVLSGHPALGRSHELLAQRTSLLIAAPIVLTLEGLPPMAITLVPLLAWAAARATAVEAVVQQFLVLWFAASVSALGMGPFSELLATYALGPDMRTASLAVFALVCGSLVLPLVVRVAEQVDRERVAATGRDVLQRVVDGTQGVAIIGTDTRGLITLFNPGAERLLGYLSESVVGKHVSLLYSPEAVAELADRFGVEPRLEAVSEALSSPDRARTELQLRRVDGVERDHAFTLSRLRDAKGGHAGWIATSEDITEQLFTRHALEDAMERLRKVDAMKDAFVSGVSHELRTPLTSVIAYLELLQLGDFGELSAEQSKALERVSAGCDRLLHLIEDILVLSRLDDRPSPHHDRLDFRRAVETGIAVVTPLWEDSGVRLATHLGDDPVWVDGDAEMLERVVVNLVGNAFKFTPGEGRVEVRIEQRDGIAAVRVTDTGIGISEAERDQVFRRFFRSEEAQKRAIPGTGLGLAICESIMRGHGGGITVASTPGEGSTFRCWLPRSARARESNAGNVQDSTSVEDGKGAA